MFTRQENLWLPPVPAPRNELIVSADIDKQFRLGIGNAWTMQPVAEMTDGTSFIQVLYAMEYGLCGTGWRLFGRDLLRPHWRCRQ